MNVFKDRNGFVLVVAGMAVMLAVSIIWAIRSFRGPSGKAAPEAVVIQQLDDGVAREMADRKSDAYRGRVNTEAYFEDLGQRMQAGEAEDFSLLSPAPESAAGPVAGTSRKEEEAVARTFGPPPQAASGSGRRGPERPAMSEQERLGYERRRAEMVRDVLAGTPESPAEEAADPVPIDLSSLGASDVIITSLDDDFADGAVQYEDGALRPFRCMFVRDQKVKSGQRVTLRLLDDYVADGVRIPANTHLAAICKIGDRLELSVRSLEMNGRIVPLTLEAYDTDGLQGIYCPETAGARAAARAKQDALTLGGRTFGGLVGDLASTMLQAGASIARSASGEVSVSVVSGYEFYLVTSERK